MASWSKELLEDGVMGEGSVEDEGGEVDEGSVEGEGDEVDEGSEWGVGSSCKQECYDGKKSLHISSLCVANFLKKRKTLKKEKKDVKEKAKPSCRHLNYT